MHSNAWQKITMLAIHRLEYLMECHVDHLEIIQESAEKRSTIERELCAIKKQLTKVGGHESGI